MRISHRGLYALKALTHLAEAYEGGLVKIHEIARLESIPEKFLEGILVTLKNARLVSSQRSGLSASPSGRLPMHCPVVKTFSGVRVRNSRYFLSGSTE